MKTSIRISIIALCLFFSSQRTTQASGGVEVAVTTSSIKITDIKNEFTSAVNGNGIFGYEAGIFLRFPIGPIYVKPKLLLDYQGGTLSYRANEVNQDVTFHAGKLLIPVLFGFNIFPAISIEGGPVFNYLIFETTDFNGNQIELTKGGLGYRIGANAKLGILNLTASYQGLKNSGSTSSTATFQTPDQFILGLGIEF